MPNVRATSHPLPPAIEITSFVKTPFNEALFTEVSQKILGKSYTLSLVICDPRRSQHVNKTFRNKNYIPNVLSFPLGKSAGELFLTLSVSDEEAPRYGHTKDEHRIFLLIHGLLHLKGHDHGSTMEKEERRYMTMFGFPQKKEVKAAKKH